MQPLDAVGIPYVFGGGHGPKPNPWADGYDCSGLVRTMSPCVGLGTVAWWTEDRTAEGLRIACQVLNAPPRDRWCLAFYGSDQRASHVVMIAPGDAYGIGASRGSSAIQTVAQADQAGASVVKLPSSAYRSDLLGFGQPPANDPTTPEARSIASYNWRTERTKRGLR